MLMNHKKYWTINKTIRIFLRQQFEKLIFIALYIFTLYVAYLFELIISISTTFFYVHTFARTIIQLARSSLLIYTDGLRIRSLIFELCLLTEVGSLFTASLNLEQSRSIEFKIGEQYGGKKKVDILVIQPNLKRD